MSNPTSPLDLGTLPVSKLLKQYAFPAIVAMTASSLYNMVDSIFIGHGVGPLAISGLALTFPFMNLSAAFGAMVDKSITFAAFFGKTDKLAKFLLQSQYIKMPY